jgi:hypothetical protein
MADMLQQASDWLEEQRTQHASRMVRYVRGVQSVELPATIGKTTFEVDDGYGVLVRHESRDFLVLVVDLMLGDGLTEPQRGDRVHETQNGTVYVYEVMAPGKEPCWRHSDTYRKTFRIHTKQIDAEKTP